MPYDCHTIAWCEPSDNHRNNKKKRCAPCLCYKGNQSLCGDDEKLFFFSVLKMHTKRMHGVNSLKAREITKTFFLLLGLYGVWDPNRNTFSFFVYFFMNLFFFSKMHTKRMHDVNSLKAREIIKRFSVLPGLYGVPDPNHNTKFFFHLRSFFMNIFSFLKLHTKRMHDVYSLKTRVIIKRNPVLPGLYGVLEPNDSTSHPWNYYMSAVRDM